MYSFTIGDSDSSDSSGEEEIYQKPSDKKEVPTLCDMWSTAHSRTHTHFVWMHPLRPPIDQSHLNWIFFPMFPYLQEAAPLVEPLPAPAPNQTLAEWAVENLCYNPGEVHGFHGDKEPQ